MEWLNYHHLLYFWTVVREGGVGPAAKALRVTQPTVSAQVRALEDAIDMDLFDRSGRSLKMNDDGRMVFQYADEIFRLGKELQDTLKGRPTGKPLRLHVGISDALPKLVCHDLLVPALSLDQAVQIVCHGDKTERLLAELAVRGLDLVLADVPVGGAIKVKAFNHLLGESGLTFFAAPKLARSYRRGFPQSLDEAPILLPTHASTIRRALEQWFTSIGVRPRVVAEFDDTGSMKNFGQGGDGIFAAPTVVEKALKSQHGVQVIGRTQEVVERFYAITVERRIKNPAVARIAENAKAHLFARQ